MTAYTMHIWNQPAETMDRGELDKLQLQRLQWTVKRAKQKVSFYKETFQKEDIHPEDIQSLDDLSKIPLTIKSDLQERYPYGMFAVPLSNVVRIHASSGTSGIPTVVGYTQNDLNQWSELIARIAVAGGVTKDDIVQVCFGYGLFTGGFGFHYGLEKVGATVIPISSGNTERQIMVMKDYETTVICCTPSYALYLAESIADHDMNINDLKLKYGLFGGEPWSQSMRVEIERRLGIDATDNYGLSEVMGPGVSMECLEKNGLHIQEDHFIPEIIDPGTGKTLPYGETGELVITTLTKEAFPMIRYRTRDITRLMPDTCPCGRTFIRMEKTAGRSDDMLIIRGVNIYPSQIESALMTLEETDPHYQIIVSRDGALDKLEIHVEINEQFFSDEMRKMKAIEEKISHKMKSALGVSVDIKLVEPRTLQRTEGKSKRVVDLRKKM